MRTWASFVTDLLATTGMTLQEVGDRCGVSRYAVSTWKLGKRVPSAENRKVLRQIAEEWNEHVETSQR